MRHRLGFLALVAALAALPAGAAHAADRCPEGLRCLAVPVPLDRSGTVPGTLELPVAVEPGTGPILLSLGGGPGQGMVRYGAYVARDMRAVAPGYRVAVMDQRGTGALALDCPRMQRANLTDLTVPPPGSVPACAHRLGAARGLFATTETVADIDAVRRALGADRLAILGVSYGTYVAERYARAHPDRVSALVLDSVVPQEDVDPLLRPSLRHAATILRQLCAHRACRGITRDPVADLARLVRRADRRAIAGRVATGPGDAMHVRIDGPALLDLLTTLTSFQQAQLARFPAAVRGALHGDPAPLLRIYALFRAGSAIPSPADQSQGLHAATLCSDVAFPWGSAAADPAGRAARVAAAARAVPAAAFGPFDRATATGNGLIATCEQWPAMTVAPPPAPGPLPPVPTLVLAGSWDLSTPMADAEREARRSPTAQLAVVPYAGHAVLTAVPCARLLGRRFFAGRPLGHPCAAHRAPAPMAPPSLPRAGRRAQAEAAVRLTVADAAAAVQSLSGQAHRFGGLRGGWLSVRGDVLALHGDALLRGVRVSGRVAAGQALRVRGRIRADVLVGRGGRLRVRPLR